MSDKSYIKILYKLKLQKRLNVDTPITFNEKLNWLKLYDRNERYTMLVDKYAVKSYVANTIGQQHVIPLFGVWDRFDDIDFDTLPQQFVLKCTHNSDGLVICKDKAEFDRNAAKKQLEKYLKRNFYYTGREWPYKNVRPRIIAETYIDSLGKQDSREYKLTCFNGKVKLITVCGGIAHSSFDVRTNDFYDRDFNYVPFYVFYKNANPSLPLPKEIDQLIDFAEKLSVGIPQVRVDFYIVNGTVYFGEMTFFTWGGFCKFIPEEYDRILGSWITLPEKRE